MRRSKDNRTDGDIHNTTCVVEPKADISPKSTYSKINQAFVDDFIVFEPNNETPQNNYALPRGMLS